jgi:hypothetical protein
VDTIPTEVPGAPNWKRKKLLLAAILTLSGFLLVFAIFVASVLWVVPEIRYQNALKALEKKDYQEAHRLFTLIKHHKDSSDYLSRFRVVNTYYRSTLDNSAYNKDRLSAGIEKEYRYGQHGNLIWTRETTLILENGEFVLDDEHPPREYDYSSCQYTYNSDGNPLRGTNPGWNGNYVIFSYDSNGRCIRKDHYLADGTLSKRYTTYSYDSNGNLLKIEDVSHDNRNITLYTYDSNGNIIEYTRSLIHNEPSEYSCTTTITYLRDRKGQVIGEESKTIHPHNHKRDSSSITKYQYNAAGQETTQETVTDTHMYKTLRTYNWRGDLTKIESLSGQRDAGGEAKLTLYASYTITYDLLGRMTQAKGFYKGTGSEPDTIYDADITCRPDGSMEKVVLRITNQSKSEQIILYDENQQIISRTTIFEDGKVLEEVYEYAYFYCPKGKLPFSEY